ncbi:hypothetical protein IQ264_01515 [Phormidium sp. LEGE 05292]|uniref:hypothetical protein n=1 Tax=[Phormidium] sp. LEGE 05292 TaxID=767427 RepID=UPI001881B994|nr:hypothetical protein [Phormidium sp. LEGE 05292]MBE9224151.1 hypothetical protein [Phormidium sp. LEGE 05292]
MKLEVYHCHQLIFTEIDYLLLTKVAIVRCKSRRQVKALMEAFYATQNLNNNSGVNNPKVEVITLSRSSRIGDVFAIGDRFWLCDRSGWKREGDGWYLINKPSLTPTNPQRYDAVLGNQMACATTSAILGGIEGVKHRLAQAVTVQQRAIAVKEALKYYNGIDLIKEIGCQHCVSVVIDSKNYYYPAIFEATKLQGYNSLYWWITSTFNFTASFVDAMHQATKIALQYDIPLFYEIAHLTKATCGWVPDNANEKMIQWDFHYAVDTMGSRLHFATKPKLRSLGVKVSGEPDRIAKNPHHRSFAPMKLWKVPPGICPSELDSGLTDDNQIN